MTLTVFDMETHDPTLKKYGSGSVFKFHYGDSIDFRVLGVGVKTENECEYIDFVNDPNAKIKLNRYLKEATILVGHNVLYDLGCLKLIYKECKELEKFLPKICDTMLMAKLENQQLDSYGLDALASLFKCEHKKESDLLHEYAWSSGLYQERHKLKTGRNCYTRPSDAVMETFCKTNMIHFPAEVVGEYCVGDLEATWDLYHIMLDKLNGYDLTVLSKIIKICLKAKFKGLRIDLNATRKLSLQWKDLAETSKNNFIAAIKDCFPMTVKNGVVSKAIDSIIHPNGPPSETEFVTLDTFNINSSEQLGPPLEALGIKVPKTLKGGYSITKDWLKEQGHPVLKELQRYRKANKAEKDFIQKIIKYQEVVPQEFREEGIGVMYPTLKPLGATLTGRFSSGGGQGSLELNILAISGRDEHFGMPIRELILPRSNNEKLICADFSNQEPRLQVHYAKLLNCQGVDEVIEGWQANPKMKYHNKVADMTQLEYGTAKMLTLGLSYGMGAYKMAERLNMPIGKAKDIIAQYHRMLPFMSQLQKATAAALKKNGYIKTIGGRKLRIDPPYEYMGKMCTNEHKAMSKLIQGSAADQLWESMVAIDEAGLDFMLCVHDEIIISSVNQFIDEPKLVQCMENAYKLVVPVISDSGVGDTWFAAKP